MKTKSNKLRTTFAVIYTDVMRSPAWAAMKPAYRALLVEMKAFYNRETKAAVPMSVRYAAKLLGVDKELAADCLEALSHYGFIREVRRGYLGANGVGIATEWRLTDEKYLRRSVTLDFLRWDGVLYEPNSRKKTKPRPEIPDRPVRIFRQPRPEIPDRVHENPNKSHFEPVRKIQTHLKIYPSSTPAVGLEAGGAEAPTEFDIGHNAGPPLNSPIPLKDLKQKRLYLPPAKRPDKRAEAIYLAAWYQIEQQGLRRPRNPNAVAQVTARLRRRERLTESDKCGAGCGND